MRKQFRFGKYTMSCYRNDFHKRQQKVSPLLCVHVSFAKRTSLNFYRQRYVRRSPPSSDIKMKFYVNCQLAIMIESSFFFGGRRYQNSVERKRQKGMKVISPSVSLCPKHSSNPQENAASGEIEIFLLEFNNLRLSLRRSTRYEEFLD